MVFRIFFGLTLKFIEHFIFTMSLIRLFVLYFVFYYTLKNYNYSFYGKINTESRLYPSVALLPLFFDSLFPTILPLVVC